MSSYHCAIDTLVPEKSLFVWLNSHHSEFWDHFMWMATDKHTWVPVIIALFAMMFIKTPLKKSLWLIVCITILATLSDQTASGFLKPYFQCLRPSHHPDFKDIVHTINGYYGGLYGFVSSHAANAFALAWFLSLVCRNRVLTIVIFIWAVINSYSRIYLGVHSVMDIIGGILVGTLAALCVYQLYVYGMQKIIATERQTAQKAFISTMASTLFATFFACYIALIAVYATLQTLSLV